MNYDFDSTLNHRGNGSCRWDLPGVPEDVIGMGTADLDFTCAPCIREALVPIAEENCYNYRQRPDRYYNGVIDWYRREFGLTVEREWLSSVPSTIGAVRMALGIYARPGDAVIVQTPVFSPIAWAVEGAGCRMIENPMKPVNGRYELDLAGFEAQIKAHHPTVFLMVNPHSPTGRVFTRKELEGLVEICAANGVTVVSDEVHGMIVYGDHPFIPLLAVNETAQRIGVQIVSLSKGYNIMSLPHAIITIANQEMQAAWMRQIRAFSFGYATNSFAVAAVTAILEGQADGWMKELNAYLRRNLEDALAYIRDNHLPLVPYVPEGSFLLWLDCHPAGIGEEHLDRFFLEKAHIHLDDGEENFGREGRGFVRINFAVTNAVLKEALERMKHAFEAR